MTSKQQPVAAKPKPPNAGKGRKAGTPNKTTTALKEAILLAATNVGADGRGKGGLTGYLETLAAKEPKAFSSLLGRALPLTIAGDKENPLHASISYVANIPKRSA